MKGVGTIFGAVVLVTGISGCSVVNPYRSDWKCPPLDNGKCVSVPQAYQEALEKDAGDPTRPGYGVPGESGEPGTGRPSGAGEGGEAPADAQTGPVSRPPSLSPAEEYQDAVYRRLAALAKEPKTPLVTPPGVWRLWFLPYEGQKGDVLFGDRHVYVVMERPRFLLGEYLGRGGE